MLTRIDHVMICVPDLEQGIDAYTRLGFDVRRGGIHPGRGTHNAIAFNEEDYLEILSVRDAAEHRSWAARTGAAGLPEFLAAGPGIRYAIVHSDDLAADVAAMRRRGVDVSDPVDGSRRTASGADLSWRSAHLGPANPLPIFVLQHLTPLDVRRGQAGGPGKHPNGVTHAERVYITVPDLAAAVEHYSRVLGISPRATERGAVIKAEMAVFDLGPTGLTVAQPAGPGPAAEALARRGPGPFQILYRTRSMGAAARWMVDHGLPAPARAVRHTGEQAMLVGPGHAAGAYLAFVGPE
jgi:catechol 2,3-dioxygenase-like lactoylglutathione lyase family enzyme